MLRIEYLSAAMQPVETEMGYASIQYAYDMEDRKISETYLDKNGMPVQISSGYAGIHYEYGVQGKVWQTTFVDTAGQPILFKDGYATVRLNYFDEKYVRTYISSGYSAVLRTVDKNGNILTETYLDLNDNPILCSAGYATVKNTCDLLNLVMRHDYLD